MIIRSRTEECKPRLFHSAHLGPVQTVQPSSQLGSPVYYEGKYLFSFRVTTKDHLFLFFGNAITHFKRVKQRERLYPPPSYAETSGHLAALSALNPVKNSHPLTATLGTRPCPVLFYPRISSD
jgi:hypothetical protein